MCHWGVIGCVKRAVHKFFHSLNWTGFPARCCQVRHMYRYKFLRTALANIPSPKDAAGVSSKVRVHAARCALA